MCDVILNGVRWTGLGIWKGIESATDAVSYACTTAAQQVGKGIHYGYNWTGKNIEQLARDHLPETAAKIVASVVWSLPYTLAAVGASLLLPSIVSNVASGIAIGTWQAVPRDVDNWIGKENRQHIFAGVRNASIIRVGMDTATMILTANWFMLLPLIGSIFIALQSHSIANQDTPPQPQPQPQAEPQPAPQKPVAT